MTLLRELEGELPAMGFDAEPLDRLKRVALHQEGWFVSREVRQACFASLLIMEAVARRATEAQAEIKRLREDWARNEESYKKRLDDAVNRYGRLSGQWVQDQRARNEELKELRTELVASERERDRLQRELDQANVLARTLQGIQDGGDVIWPVGSDPSQFIETRESLTSDSLCRVMDQKGEVVGRVPVNASEEKLAANGLRKVVEEDWLLNSFRSSGREIQKILDAEPERKENAERARAFLLGRTLTDGSV